MKLKSFPPNLKWLPVAVPQLAVNRKWFSVDLLRFPANRKRSTADAPRLFLNAGPQTAKCRRPIPGGTHSKPDPQPPSPRDSKDAKKPSRGTAKHFWIEKTARPAPQGLSAVEPWSRETGGNWGKLGSSFGLNVGGSDVAVGEMQVLFGYCFGGVRCEGRECGEQGSRCKKCSPRGEARLRGRAGMLPAVPGILPGTSNVAARAPAPDARAVSPAAPLGKATRVLRPVRRVGYPARRVRYPPYPRHRLSPRGDVF